MRFLWPRLFALARAKIRRKWFWQGKNVFLVFWGKQIFRKSNTNPYLFQICPDLFPRKKGSKSKANLDLYQICPDLFPRKKGSKSKANLDLYQICPDLFPRKREANRKQIIICIRFVQICFREKKGSKSKANLDLFQIGPDLFPRNEPY